MIGAIDYACPSCGRKLTAPEGWIGRGVSCPVCGHTAPVPSQSPSPAPVDNDDDIEEAIPDIVFAAPVEGPAIPPATPPRPGFFRRNRVYIISGAVLLALFGWWGSWKWYYENYVKAEAIMKSRGYGRQLSAPPTDDTKADALVNAVFAAEARQFGNPDDLEATMSLAAAYDAALREIDHVRKDRANHILNNAAWLFATTPHLGLRDPDRALKLAEGAVAGTSRSDTGYLDTLAEALYVNGRAGEALAVSREALSKKPDDQYLIDRERHFAVAAEESRH